MLKSYSHCVCDLQYHLVLFLKYRHLFLSQKEQDEVAAGLRPAATSSGGLVIALSVQPDHVHLQVQLHPSVCVSSFVSCLKRKTTRFLPLTESWSRGYFCSSVGVVDEYKVRSYIKGQGV